MSDNPNTGSDPQIPAQSVRKPNIWHRIHRRTVLLGAASTTWADRLIGLSFAGIGVAAFLSGVLGEESSGRSTLKFALAAYIGVLFFSAFYVLSDVRHSALEEKEYAHYRTYLALFIVFGYFAGTFALAFAALSFLNGR